MQGINEAWAVLGDPEQRSSYDRKRMRGGGTTSMPDTAPRRPWVPLDDSDDDLEHVDPDLFDADLLDDTPYGDGAGVPRALQIIPALLVVVAVVGYSVALVTGLRPVLALAIISTIFAGVLFVVAPLVAFAHGARGSRS